jgi:hypothetical protein
MCLISKNGKRMESLIDRKKRKYASEKLKNLGKNSL